MNLLAVPGLCRTYGAPDFLRIFPGLPAWANLFRAYRAGEWRMWDAWHYYERAKLTK
jgi:hypothetical protein